MNHVVPRTLKKASLALLVSAALSGAALAASSPELEAIQNELDSMKEKLDLTLDMLERQSGKTGMSGGHGHGSSGKTSIGGYGEMHYNYLENQTAGGDDQKEIDLHRFILFVGHEFSDSVRFFSELEVEHAQSDKNGGEVAMEQAYLEFDIGTNTVSRAGVFLVPVGIINETHEPPTFYGVERNPVEKNIIPTTWREGGVSLSGRLNPGLSYDLALHSGLGTKLGTSPDLVNYAVRKGRNAVRQAPANDPAVTARIKWTGMPGLELGATVQQQTDVTQSTDNTAGSATLLEAHVVWSNGPMSARALYATWDLSGSGPAANGSDEQTGWYVEPAYKVTPKLGLFARYNQWDNQAGDSADSEFTQTNLGVNYWPHPDVVVKMDYQTQDVPTGENEYQGVNLGVGYQF